MSCFFLGEPKREEQAPDAPPSRRLKVEVCNGNLSESYVKAERIVAFGDIHGDIGALKACLQIGGICDAYGQWTAPPGTAVVILGDVVDRFRNDAKIIKTEIEDGMVKSLREQRNEELTILELLNKLARLAQFHGSHVIRLVGNHEVLQALHGPGPQMKYSSPFSVDAKGEEKEKLSAYMNRWESFRFKNGKFHEAIGDCYPLAVMQVGSHLFVHGGINLGQIEAANKQEKNLIDYANSVFKDFWEGKKVSQEDFLILMATSSRRGGTKEWAGVLWDDELSTPDVQDEVCKAEAEKILEALNENLQKFGRGHLPRVEHIVVSHCQQFQRGTKKGMEQNRGFIPANVIQGLSFTDYTTKGAGEPRFVPTPKENRTANTECNGVIWRLDVGMSRAFAPDFTKLKKKVADESNFLNSMRPVVLIVDGDGRDYTVRQSLELLPGVKSVV